MNLTEKSGNLSSLNNTADVVDYLEVFFLWIILSICCVSVIFICTLIYLMTRIDSFFSQKYNIFVFGMSLCDMFTVSFFCVFCVVRLFIISGEEWHNLCCFTIMAFTIFGIDTEMYVLFIVIARFIATYSTVNACLSRICSPKFAVVVNVAVAINLTIVMTRLGMMNCKECSFLAVSLHEDSNLILNTVIGATVCSIEASGAIISCATIFRLFANKKKVQCTTVVNGQGTTKLKKNVVLLSVTIIIHLCIFTFILYKVIVSVNYVDAAFFSLLMIRPVVNPFLYMISIKEVQQKLRDVFYMCKCRTNQENVGSQTSNIE